ncbi:MAG: addiction module protein [Rhodoferax sp.]
MSQLATELSVRARELSPQDRAWLAEDLLASLAPSDEALTQAWDEEIRRRVDEVERSSVPLIPADEAFAQVRQALQA